MRTNDWNDWHCFVSVARLGGFTRAAERMDVPKSTVSMAVARLEQRLGVRLLERSTRRMRLTEDGERLMQEIGPLFERLEDIADHVDAGDASLGGVLRIAATYEFGSMQLGDVITEMMLRHPKLSIEVDVVSGIVDPLADGYDIAFVVTALPLPDSRQVARRVFDAPRGLYASPELVAQLGQPKTPADLAHWPQIAAPYEGEWTFSSKSESDEITLPLHPRLRTANAWLRVRAAVSGLGATVLARSFCEDECDAGRLVPLLPDYEPHPLRIYALLPARSLMPAKSRHFLDAVEALLTDSPFSKTAPWVTLAANHG